MRPGQAENQLHNEKREETIMRLECSGAMLFYLFSPCFVVYVSDELLIFVLFRCSLSHIYRCTTCCLVCSCLLFYG